MTTKLIKKLDRLVEISVDNDDMSAPEILRRRKVEDIQANIKNGRYRIDSEELAEKLLQSAKRVQKTVQYVA